MTAASTRPPARAPARARQAAQKAARRRARFLIGGAAVTVIVVALVLALLVSGSPSTTGVTTGAAAEAVVTAATSVPVSVSSAVGRGTATRAPTAVQGPALTAGGTPEILYIGAEYCPYCAAERWAMVVALSRFGTFAGLGLTHSSSTDTFPDTATFTFHGATFSSPYLTFSAVETATNQPGGSGYTSLDTPTPQQAAVWAAADPQQSIPFIDIGGRYVVAGATYDPGVLQGKTATEIATSLTNPSSGVAKAVLGAANGITAAICATTGNQPAAACG